MLQNKPMGIFLQIDHMKYGELIRCNIEVEYPFELIEHPSRKGINKIYNIIIESNSPSLLKDFVKTFRENVRKEISILFEEDNKTYFILASGNLVNEYELDMGINSYSLQFSLIRVQE